MRSNILHEGIGKRIKGVALNRQTTGRKYSRSRSKEEKQKAGSEAKGVADEKGQGEI